VCACVCACVCLHACVYPLLGVHLYLFPVFAVTMVPPYRPREVSRASASGPKNTEPGAARMSLKGCSISKGTSWCDLSSPPKKVMARRRGQESFPSGAAPTLLALTYRGTAVVQWCYSGVTMVLQWCHSGVTVVLQWCYSDVTVVLQWCHNGVTVVSQGLTS
jgi:hypothetical protein